MKESLKKFAPILVAILAFVIISVGYFSPVLEGKKIFQNDIKHFIGMAKEVNDFRTENNEAEPYWTNGAFGGMPTYNLSAKYPYAYIKKLDNVLRFLPRPADYLFLYLLSFFILLLVLKVDVKLAFLGAVAFGFSTYYIIILGVGHNAKAHAIAYMPLVLAGILLVFRKKYLWGFVITVLAMALEITASHPQMAYYLLLTTLILGLTFFVEALKNKELPTFFKQIAILIVAVMLAIGTNATGLLATKEYAAYSTRGKSELTINADGSPKKASNGLSKDYITQYSYGKLETFNLFIPRFMGGGNAENVGLDSNIYKFLKKKVDAKQAKQFAEHAPMYWGKQPIVEAPAYIGATLLFFFLLGVFLLKGKYRNWLLATFIVSILLSWGKNLNTITNLFIDYVPLYNKFRAVSSIQVIAELVVPLLGILALKEWFSTKNSSKEKLKALKITFYIAGGFALIFTLFGSSLFAFESFRDETYNQMLPSFLQAILADREAVFFKDSLRTLIFVTISAAVLWLFLKEKLSKNVAIGCLTLVVLIDLISVDRRYVNNDNFLSARKIDKPFIASEIDKQILQDKSIYRVANFSLDPMNDGSTSYFYSSIGGYHAAKMERYQELYDYQIAKNNVEVLNMLNTKYFKFTNKQQKEVAEQNPEANGNVWFVNKLKLVNNANEEIMALDSLKTKVEAVIDRNNLKTKIRTEYKVDTTSIIKLVNYKTNKLVYKSSTAENEFAVFSEIYYKNGWNAYVDDVLKPYYRVNYVLRGMEIPKGNHTIEFKFEPTVIKTGTTITLVSYFFLILIPIGWFFVEKKTNKS